MEKNSEKKEKRKGNFGKGFHKGKEKGKIKEKEKEGIEKEKLKGKARAQNLSFVDRRAIGVQNARKTDKAPVEESQQEEEDWKDWSWNWSDEG